MSPEIELFQDVLYTSETGQVFQTLQLALAVGLFNVLTITLGTSTNIGGSRWSRVWLGWMLTLVQPYDRPEGNLI